MRRSGWGESVSRWANSTAQEGPVRQAMGLLENLIADSPGDPVYWLDLAECHFIVMDASERLDRKEQAIAESLKVLAVYERLVTGHPQVA